MKRPAQPLVFDEQRQIFIAGDEESPGAYHHSRGSRSRSADQMTTTIVVLAHVGMWVAVALFFVGLFLLAAPMIFSSILIHWQTPLAFLAFIVSALLAEQADKAERMVGR